MKKRDASPISLAEERAITRRGFLAAAGGTAALALAGEWLGRHLAAAPEPGVTIHLPDTFEVALGDARALELPGSRQQVLVARPDRETLVAFDRRCPHLGCPVLWSAERQRFECPCHAAAFDARTGRVLAGPPRRGLAPVGVEIGGTRSPRQS